MEDKPMLKKGPDLSYQTPAPSWAYAPPPFPTPESPESSDIPMYQPLHSDDESLPDTNDLLAPTPNTISGNTPVEIHVDEDVDGLESLLGMHLLDDDIIIDPNLAG